MKKKGKQYLALALTVAVATPVVATNVIPTIIVCSSTSGCNGLCPMQQKEFQLQDKQLMVGLQWM